MTLKDYRCDKRLSMTDVAEQSGITLSLYSQIESGKKPMTVRSAMKISPVLGVKWYELIEATKTEEDENDG